MNLNLTTATRIGLNILALLGMAVALYLGQKIFIPVVLAALLAVILHPAAHWLHRRAKFPWFLACLTAILGLIAINLALFVGFTISITRVLQDLPQTYSEQVKFYEKIRMQLDNITPGNIEDILPARAQDSQIFQQIVNSLKPESLRGPLWDLSVAGASWLWQSILTLFILLFLLVEGEMLARRVREIFPADRIAQGRVASALGEMAQAVRAYLIWRTIVNIGLGVFLGVIYQGLGLRQPWVWALFTAVLCYVPYIGTIIAGIPPVIDAFIYSSHAWIPSAWVALIVLVVYIAVVTFEGYIIVPVVMGRSVDLNATTVLIACLFWELVWGIPGLFLAMPLMAGVRAICMHVDGWQSWGKLMSTYRGVEAYEKAQRLKSLSERIESIDDTTVVMEGLSPNGSPLDGEPRSHDEHGERRSNS